MSVVFLIFVVLALAATASDVLLYDVTNALILALLFVFIIVTYAAMPGTAWHGHVLAAAATLLLTVMLYLGDGMRAGDAKLLPAFALWAGPNGLFPLLFYAAIFALLGVILLRVLRWLIPEMGKRKWISMPETLPRVLRKGEAIPYAIGIGPGAILATSWFPAWLWHV